MTSNQSFTWPTKNQPTSEDLKPTLIPRNPLRQAPVASSCLSQWSWSLREARDAHARDDAFGQPPFPLQERPASPRQLGPSRLDKALVTAEGPHRLAGKGTWWSRQRPVKARDPGQRDLPARLSKARPACPRLTVHHSNADHNWLAISSVRKASFYYLLSNNQMC